MTYRRTYSGKRNRPNLKITQRIRIAHVKAWAFLLCVYVLGRTSLTDRKCPTLIIFTNICFGTFENNIQIVKKLLLSVQREIKKARIYLILIVLIFVGITVKGCSYSDKNKAEPHIENPIIEKSAIELEDESMAKGIVQDSTLLGFVFGMTKDQVIAHYKKLKAENIIGYLTDGNVYYAVETKSFRKVALKIKFHYDNENKLFRITEQPVMLDRIEKKKKSNLGVNVANELLVNYKRDLGNRPLTNGTQTDAKFYWLKGDKRFDFLEADSTCVLARTKISTERKMIVYYEQIERKKQEQERVNQEEEILQKVKLGNLQIQEEQRIITKLKAKAKRDWPDDYTTQEFWINEQIEAYHYMLTIPNSDRIKEKAQRDWPLDFSTQKFWYNEQIEARLRLQ